LARKGLKETKFFPAKRAGEQSSVGHWIKTFIDARRHATKFIVLHRSLQQIPAFLLGRFGRRGLSRDRWQIRRHDHKVSASPGVPAG
jgi:hypothetical protein